MALAIFAGIFKPMKVSRGILGPSIGPLALSIGNFDGLHMGHEAMLRKLKAESLRRGCESAVVLFEPQPKEYFLGKNAPPRLMSLREKIIGLKRLSIDKVLCLSFNNLLAGLSPDDFIEQIIHKRLDTRYLLVGEDFRFGHQRAGDIELLKTAQATHGYTLDIFKTKRLEDEKIASTSVRQALLEDNLKLAQKGLNRPFSMIGRVVRGHKRGREIGVPTANIAMHKRRPPIKGVFCVRVKRANGELHNGVANLGTRPTVDGTTPYLEVHLFDFDENIYREYIEVMFIEKLRSEMRFDSLDALVKQIKIDINDAKKRLV